MRDGSRGGGVAEQMLQPELKALESSCVISGKAGKTPEMVSLRIWTSAPFHWKRHLSPTRSWAAANEGLGPWGTGGRSYRWVEPRSVYQKVHAKRCPRPSPEPVLGSKDPGLTQGEVPVAARGCHTEMPAEGGGSGRGGVGKAARFNCPFRS